MLAHCNLKEICMEITVRSSTVVGLHQSLGQLIYYCLRLTYRSDHASCSSHQRSLHSGLHILTSVGLFLCQDLQS